MPTFGRNYDEPVHQRIFYTVVNCGDGSYNVEYFLDRSLIDKLSDFDPEYYPSESDGCFDVFGRIEGIHITTAEEVNQRYDESGVERDFYA